MLRDFLGTQALLLDLVIDCRLLGGYRAQVDGQARVTARTTLVSGYGAAPLGPAPAGAAGNFVEGRRP